MKDSSGKEIRFGDVVLYSYNGVRSPVWNIDEAGHIYTDTHFGSHGYDNKHVAHTGHSSEELTVVDRDIELAMKMRLFYINDYFKEDVENGDDADTQMSNHFYIFC